MRETLVVLRFIKDNIEKDGIYNIIVTKEMMKFLWKCKEWLQCILTGAKTTRRTYKSRNWSKKKVQVELKESVDVLNQETGDLAERNRDWRA